MSEQRGLGVGPVDPDELGEPEPPEVAGPDLDPAGADDQDIGGPPPNVDTMKPPDEGGA